MAFLLFIVRRARQHWPILLTLSLGVVLATALLASGPLLIDAVIEMGLYLTLESTGVTEGNLRITTSPELDQAGFQTLDGEIQALLQGTLGGHVDRVVRSGESAWLLPWDSGQVATDQRVSLCFYEGIQERIEYIAGEWPEQVSDDPRVVPVVVSDAMARTFVLRVGDRLPLSLTQNRVEPDAWIEVVGIVSPQNPLDPYWFGEFNPLTPQTTQHGLTQHHVILSEEAFFAAASSFFPGEEIALAWHVLLRHAALSTGDIEPFQAKLLDLNAQLNTLPPHLTLRHGVSTYTGVRDVLATFQRQLESIRVPLYIFVAEVMLLVLYYVTMVAALSMRQVEREFAILRSRGTSGWQIARIQLAEALIILGVALLSGPWLGLAMVRGLTWIGPLADVGRADWSLSPGQSAWLAAGVGALASLGGLLLPLGPALRRSIVTHQQMVARRTQPPWWQRLYLDVFVLGGGLVLLWRLRLYGEMTTSGPGGARLDWLLLLSPVALLLGTATILLRVFPLVLRAMASLVTRGEGSEGALALWQASRNPTHVTRLVLLLTLAIALGNLSTGLNITLDQSEYDRAHYLAGNDVRLTARGAVPLMDLQSAPSVLRLSGAWRGQGTVDLESAQAPSEFEVLAIEPDSFSKVTAYRRDFSDDDLDELVAHLAVPQGEHPALLLLPGRPARFGLWVWGPPENKAEMDSYQRWIDGDNDAERVGLVAKLQTAQGELFTVRLQRPEPTLAVDRFALRGNIGGHDVGLNVRIRPDNKGWTYFDGALPVFPASSYPLSLHSLWFENQATRLGEPIAKGIGLVLDNLTVVDAESGTAHIVEDFEGLDRTIFLNIMYGSSIYHGLYTMPTNKMSYSGTWGQLVGMSATYPGQTYALRLRQTWTADPLPALASPAFLETTKLGTGDVVRTWIGSAEVDFRIAGAVDHFPTMYEDREAGYLITSRDLLLALLNDATQLATNPNEVLIETDGSASLESLSSRVPTLTQSWDAESVRKTLKANPLALGLRGVTFFGSALTIFLSLVGFATHFYLTIRQRETLFGVMRALGMSSRQVYRSIVIEQAILILTGLALGTGLGVLLNQITLPRLPVSLGDTQPVPPFLARADWLAVGLLYLLLAIAFMVILGIVTALLWRARVHRVLRIGQE